MGPVRLLGGFGAAVRRSRAEIAASAAAYLGGALLGIACVSAGLPFAVQQRDAVVAGAQGGSILTAYRGGHRLEAALLDFGANALLGAGPTALTGLVVVGPFPIAAYRGWIGGIVSVGPDHRSRLAEPRQGLYYGGVMLLQLAGYTLAMAAGLHLGLAAWRSRKDEGVRAVLGFRIGRAALADAGRLYALALPLLLAGSLVEFLSAP